MRISDWSSDVCSSDLLTLRFDRIDLDQAGWSVPREARQAALQGLEPDLRAALEMAAERIRAYHAGQKPEDRDETDAAGARRGARWQAVDSAGRKEIGSASGGARVGR